MRSREIRPDGAIYRLLRQVGEGRTATVFQAERVDSKALSRQIVALKILKDQNSVQYLRREFSTLAAVNSPHCVRVLAWENLDKGNALALEWIDGITLMELAKSTNFSTDLIDEIIAQAQDGLRVLDKAKLFHGDLHPKNILIDRLGCVRLVDFASIAPSSGIAFGVPAYFAPEIWRGEKHSIQSDMFSLGLIALDLHSRFELAPQESHSARLRCEGLDDSRSATQVRDNELLNFHPNLRQFKQVISLPERRECLARAVAHMLSLKVDIGETRAVNIVKNKNLLRVVLRPFALALSLLIAMSAIGSEVSSDTQPDVLANLPKTYLEIRTNHWIQVQLDGQDLGFAPIQMSGIAPGQHRLNWRGPCGIGMTQFFFRSGETLRLSDRAFRSCKSPRN